MHGECLLKLADYLETVPSDRFTMMSWREPHLRGEGNECGFAGCAMGWAAHSGLFPGLKLVEHETNTGAVGYYPVFRGFASFTAAAILFAISSYEAELLFRPSSYSDIRNPKMVAAGSGNSLPTTKPSQRKLWTKKFSCVTLSKDGNTRNKYGAKVTFVDNIRFHSKKEAKEYESLKLLEKVGAISGLKLQVRYPLNAPNGEVVGHYVSDFDYVENGELVTHDVKGFRDSLYKWKKRHFQAQYKRNIKET